MVNNFIKFKENGNLLTFLDSTSTNSELDEMDKYILMSLLQSKAYMSNINFFK